MEREWLLEKNLKKLGGEMNRFLPTDANGVKMQKYLLKAFKTFRSGPFSRGI